MPGRNYRYDANTNRLTVSRSHGPSEQITTSVSFRNYRPSPHLLLALSVIVLRSLPLPGIRYADYADGGWQFEINTEA